MSVLFSQNSEQEMTLKTVHGQNILRCVAQPHGAQARSVELRAGQRTGYCEVRSLTYGSVRRLTTRPRVGLSMLVAVKVHARLR